MRISFQQKLFLLDYHIILPFEGKKYHTILYIEEYKNALS